MTVFEEAELMTVVTPCIRESSMLGSVNTRFFLFPVTEVLKVTWQQQIGSSESYMTITATL
jgi:hypothetical protein